MSVNRNVAVCLAKFGYEAFDGSFLGIGAVVLGRCAILCYTSAIGYSDGIGVLSYAMCAHLAERSAFVDGSISIDDVVIAYAIEASLSVPMVYQSYCAVLRCACGCAVDDNLVDGASHDG